VKKIARRAGEEGGDESEGQGLKKTAVTPPRKTRGAKTTMGVRVDPMSAG
jgi:hypothetical protein